MLPPALSIGNLLAHAEPPAAGERTETLLQHGPLRIERIVSSAAITPMDFCQEQDEWVALLRGEATLEVAGQTVELGPGDHVFLPARTPHRVLRCSTGALWLAVHLDPASG
ncbi:MAG: cupin domain-containing protein [Myxococcales bacterium]|nr:cupin domain-containing protein [Myxococcota bacterium]MDW8283030.1 cupin domain-containing protein [Myxococcales bacterium]